jgi:hypothetical protein
MSASGKSNNQTPIEENTVSPRGELKRAAMVRAANHPSGSHISVFCAESI